MDGQEGGGTIGQNSSPSRTSGGVPLAAQGWKDPGPLICLVPADPSPSMTATPSSRVYGVSLGAHLQELGQDIALPIEACVLMLLSEGVKEEVGPTGTGGEGVSVSSVCPKPPSCCPCCAHNPSPRAQVQGEGARPPVTEATPPPT